MRNKLISLSSITLLLVVLVACNQKQAPSKRTSWHELGIKGEVQQSVTNTYHAYQLNGEWTPKDLTQTSVATFTTDGMYATETTLDIEGNPFNRITYDSKNNMITTITYYESNDYLMGYGKVIYDKEKNMSCSMYADKAMTGKPNKLITYTFNKQGKKLTDTWTDLTTNEILSNEIYSYNEEKYLSLRRGMLKDEGEAVYEYQYLNYDNKGNWTKRLVTRRAVGAEAETYVDTRTYVYYQDK